MKKIQIWWFLVYIAHNQRKRKKWGNGFNMRKYLFSIGFIIIFIGMITFHYFFSIWSNWNDVEEKMINKAYQEVHLLANVDDIDYFMCKSTIEKSLIKNEGVYFHLFSRHQSRRSSPACCGRYGSRDELLCI